MVTAGHSCAFYRMGVVLVEITFISSFADFFFLPSNVQEIAFDVIAPRGCPKSAKQGAWEMV